MLVAFRIVLNRWAIVSTVRFFVRFSKAFWMSSSDTASSALVASSRIKILGFCGESNNHPNLYEDNINPKQTRIIALAIATLCFCPPLSMIPRWPTRVFKPSGKSLANSYTCASRMTRSNSASDILSPRFSPYKMFSRIVPLKRIGSWQNNTCGLIDSYEALQIYKPDSLLRYVDEVTLD